MGEAIILELKAVVKRFGTVPAVNGVNATVARGEYVCILGPSGCGKSTLLRMIAGFIAPDAGQIILAGRDVSGVQPEHRQVNTVFQNYALFPHMTVFDNVAFGLRMKKRPQPEIRRRVAEVLALVHLSGEADRFPGQLSGGQQQRVALARAIINQPEILLLDEPLAALDKNLRLAMQEELRTIQREVGITFLHVTHDQHEAMSLSDRMIIMRSGIFEQVGPPRTLYERPVSRFVAEFLGMSNIVPAIPDAGGRSVTLPNGVRLYLNSHPPANLPGARFDLMVRPENIELLPPTAAHRDENCFPGRITARFHIGAESLFTIEAAGVRLKAQLLSRHAAQFSVDDPIIVHLPAEHLVPIPGEAADVITGGVA